MTKGKNSVRKEQERFFDYVRSRDMTGIRRDFPAIDKSSSIYKQVASSDTVLHLAARNGNLKTTKFIIEDLGLNFLLTYANNDGKSALHEAAQFLHCEVASYLISAGSPVDILKRADWTPLMLACTRQNSSSMVELLLNSNCDPRLRNKDGWTAFHIATRTGDFDSLSILQAHDGAIWKTSSRNGRTPLHTAALHGHMNIVQWLLSSLSNEVDLEDSCGTTPLMDATRNGSMVICEMLIKNGADLYKCDKIGRNVLHVAAQAGVTDILKELCLKYGMDVNVTTTGKQSPLHLASREGHLGTVKFLMSIGADRLLRDSCNMTAMDLAKTFGHESVRREISDEVSKCEDQCPNE